MKKNRKSIFKLLLGNIVVFLVLSIVSVAIGVGVRLYSLEKSMDGVPFPKITADQIVKKNYEDIDIESVKSLNGWIEVLDENKNVIYIKGEKIDSYKKSYTERELYRLLDFSNNEKYMASIEEFYDKEGNKRYLMVKYPSESINIKFVIKDYKAPIVKPLVKGAIYGVLILLALIAVNIVFSVLWTSKKIVKPLKLILVGIERMKKGEYVEDIDFKAAREFEDIKDAFNEMNTQLRKSNEEKREMEKSRNRMFRDLSHDIKTPITSIQGFSRILVEDRIEDEEKKKRYYETIYKKSCRVGELVENLFEYVKLDSAEFKMEKKEKDICEFLRRVISEYYDEVENKGMDIIIDIPEEEILVEFDPFLLQRGIANIIENGIKYNIKGTVLKVSLKRKGEDLTITVGDNGIGIPKHIRENIFEAFTRGDQSRSSNGGTGLGLSITKKIVHLHQWDIRLCEENKEEKTIFEIKIKKI